MQKVKLLINVLIKHRNSESATNNKSIKHPDQQRQDLTVDKNKS